MKDIHTFNSGQKRFEISQDGNYVVFRVRKRAWTHMVNAAYVGVCASHEAGRPFSPSATDMIFKLRQSDYSKHGANFNSSQTFKYNDTRKKIESA